MKKTKDTKVCATVRILPSEYACDDLCDFDVVPDHHPSFRASMLSAMLEQIKERIQQTHSSNIEITQSTDGPQTIVTLTYHPKYFNSERPFEEFVLWIEGLWRRGLADYHRTKREQIKARSHC